MLRIHVAHEPYVSQINSSLWGPVFDKPKVFFVFILIS